MKTGKAQDAEQNPHGAIRRGINDDDLVAAMAPRPVCIGAAASDFFPIEGVHEIHDRIRRVYDLYDAAEQVELVVADGGHASVYEIDGILPWLCRQLGAGPYESHADLAVSEPEALRCTPKGSVLEAFPDSGRSTI